MPRTPYHKQGLLSTACSTRCWAQIHSNIGTGKLNPDNICHFLEGKKGPVLLEAPEFLTAVTHKHGVFFKTGSDPLQLMYVLFASLKIAFSN